MINLALLGAIASSGGVDPGSWIPLESTVLTGSASEITVTSAGAAEAWSNFEDLAIIFKYRKQTTSGTSYNFRINNDASSSAYWYTRCKSTSGSLNPQGGVARTYGRVNASVPSTSEGTDFYGYSVAYFNSINDTTLKVSANTTGWSQTTSTSIDHVGTNWVGGSSAATEIDFYLTSGDFASGTAITVYGIKAVA